MRVSRLRIGVDVDDVLGDLLTPLFAFLNQRYGTAHTPAELPAWDLTPLLAPGDVESFWRDFGRTDVHATLAPAPGAAEGLRALAELGDVYAVTSPLRGSARWVEDRHDWLQAHFAIPHDRVVHTHAKHTFHGHALVDDNPRHVQAWQAEHPTGHGILWGGPHNRASTVRPRAERWAEVHARLAGALDPDGVFETAAATLLRDHHGLAVSRDGARCAHLLAEWLGGMHHFPGGTRALVRTDWSGACVEVSLRAHVTLATDDSDALTRLVLLAHDHAVRVELLPAMRALKLRLSPRPREGCGMVRHRTRVEAAAPR